MVVIVPFALSSNLATISFGGRLKRNDRWYKTYQPVPRDERPNRRLRIFGDWTGEDLLAIRCTLFKKLVIANFQVLKYLL